MIEVRFELLESHGIILDGHVFGNETLAVSLLDVASQPEILRRGPPELAIPMNAGAADAVAEHKRPILAIRDGDLVEIVANRDRLVGERLPQVAANAISELVGDARVFEIRSRVARRAALQRDDIQSGVGQGFRHDGAGPAVTDDDGIGVFLALRHQFSLR